MWQRIVTGRYKKLARERKALLLVPTISFVCLPIRFLLAVFLGLFLVVLHIPSGNQTYQWKTHYLYIILYSLMVHPFSFTSYPLQEGT